MKSDKWAKRQGKQLARTQMRSEYIGQRGFRVIEKWEYESELIKENEELQTVITRSQPVFFKNHKRKVSEETILDAVRSEERFGLLEVDIKVS